MSLNILTNMTKRMEIKIFTKDIKVSEGWISKTRGMNLPVGCFL